MHHEVITMSDKELERVKLLSLVSERAMTQVEAGKRLGIGSRQVRRLLRGYTSAGAAFLVSKKRGQASNRAYTQAFKEKVIRLVECYYKDFRPKYAAEMLQERHAINLSAETLRVWMGEAGLWAIKNKKAYTYHPRRERRRQCGELIQIDGSYHDWLEGRSEQSKQCLIVFIDDATSKIMKMRFYPHESLLAYYTTLQLYVEDFGLPMALYSDKLSVFNLNATTAAEDGLTQFGNAMDKLGIHLIKATSPQAKGRVERCNQTLQDRLIKWMRLEGINSYEAANACLDTYRDIHNQKFSVIPADSKDAHCKVAELAAVERHLVKLVTRTISKALTISYGNKTYNLTFKNQKRRLHGKTVVIRDDLKGKIKIELEGQEVAYQIHSEQPKQSELTQKQREADKPKHLIRSKYIPPADHPWRRHYQHSRSMHNI